MVSFHSITEEVELFKLIRNNEKLSPDWYYLGFSDRSSDAGYKWQDGSGIDYLNWGAGQPEKTTSGEECSGIVSGTSETPEARGWFSTYCVDQGPCS